MHSFETVLKAYNIPLPDLRSHRYTFWLPKAHASLDKRLNRFPPVCNDSFRIEVYLV